MSRRRIQIFDTTLRDGEQSPGIALQPHEKAEIAEQLERLGVDVIEAGFAGASPGDFEGVRAVARAVTGPTVASLVRTVQDGHRRRRRGARGRAAAPASTSFSRRARCTWRRSSASSRTRSSSAHAGPSATRPRGSTRSSSRARTRPAPIRAFVAGVCRVAIEAGATIINLPDTVGYALPGEYAAFIADVRRRCPELRNVQLSVHCHNDLGLARRELARGDPGRRDAGRVHRQRDRRARRQRVARGDRHGVERPQRSLPRRRDRDPHGGDHRRVEARLRADRLRRPAEQGGRRRERVRTRGRHPPGRDAEGRADVPDHGSGRRRRAR